MERLQSSVSEFSDQVAGASPKDVMDILLLSQYFDTLSVVGANSLILEHDPATGCGQPPRPGRTCVLEEEVKKRKQQLREAAAEIVCTLCDRSVQNAITCFLRCCAVYFEGT